MKKSTIYFCLIFLQSFSIEAQNTIYDFIKPGNFSVGYTDTLVFDSTCLYDAYNYKGMKPYFIKIWHPIIKKSGKQDFLTFNDFFETYKNDDLAVIQNQLNKNYKEIIIRDYIEENLATGEAQEYGSYSSNDILELIGKTETKSFPEPVIGYSQFPVILYHHGSQSNSFENYLMAEYFASRGFIFVSANFHLPYENTLFGLKPFDKIIKDDEEQSLRTVLRFAKSLSNTQFVFFIGHSWGAQMGLRTFDRDSTIKALISLETTIEFKTDYEQIKEIWPEVFQKVITENARYPFPILFCAATGQEQPFVFFEKLNASQIIFAPTKAEFEHNAYTSIFYLRQFPDNSVNQTDKEIQQDRLCLYAKHIGLIDEFITGILKNENKSGDVIRFVKCE